MKRVKVFIISQEKSKQMVILQFGGTNEVSNLAALCNNCHANKTSMNNL